ncbi:DMT family transporter [Candidatus Gottesmanbacteria bacterium]|nr:DMT family transporter [Candidatus Gottesmanbacteria bacterium]
MSERIKKGIIFSLFTALISGFSIFYNKFVVIGDIDPLILNIIKNGGVAFLLSFILLMSPQKIKLHKLSFNQWKKLLLIGLIGGSIPFVLFFEGLRQVQAVNANLIHKTLFIWVAVLAIPVLGEKLNIWQIVGYLIIAWSNLFIGGFTGFLANRGEIMIFAATLLWSSENIVAKIALRDIDSGIVAWGRMFIGSIFLIILAVTQNKLLLLTRVTTIQLLSLSVSILFLTGYVVCWFKALRLAPATVVTSVLILATPITNILTALLITHNLPQIQLVNVITTSFGLSLIILLSSLINKLKLQNAKAKANA